jgi:outer membrane protein assembly factor BamB
VRLALAIVLALSSTASARGIHGLVYDDANGDGLPSAGERGIAGAVVSYEGRRFGKTDANGRYELDVPLRAGGIVWVRVPDGFVPGPAWTRVDGREELDVGLRRLPAPHRGPLTFTVAADTHLSAERPFALDLGAVARAATALDPPPAFFTILGDVTGGSQPAHFALVDQSLEGLEVPYVPVPGNHDWYDGGAAWRAHYGPDNYSFDIGDVHFVVWNMALSEDEVDYYLGAELALVAPGMTVVALTHAPPHPGTIHTLRKLGVDYLLTGHTHSNRVVDHDGLVELTTEPLLMGGLDFTPAGYRIATIDRGVLTAVHRAVVEAPLLSVIAPEAGRCAPPGAQLIAAAELDAGAAAVTARFDCGPPIALAHAGGWSWRAALPSLSPGRHTVTVEARAPSGARVERAVAFDVCAATAAAATAAAAAATAPPAGAAWPQLGGDARHTGATPRVIAPPLAARWVTPIGGHVLQAPPAVAGGLVFATATDLGSGRSGGVIALGLADGAVRWRARTELPVRGGPAVAGGVVAVAMTDGTVLGFDAATGAPRWRYELGTGLPPEAATVHASPAVSGGELLVGNQRYLAAIAAATGATAWTVDPVPAGENSQSLAAVAIGDGIAVGTFNRALGGVAAWDRADGQLLWRVEGARTIAVNATPVIDGDTVYIVNGLTEVLALELATGEPRWRSKLDPAGFDWGHATAGTPAIARGVLVVPILYGALVGLDAASGAELWRRPGTPGPLRTTHYRGAGETAYEASPVITGDIVWAADTSGRLEALELRTGVLLWRTELGAPVLAGLAVAGDWLIAASFDGTVRALAPVPATAATAAAAAPARPLACDVPPARGGCCDAGAGAPPRLAGAALMLAAAWAFLQRRRRPRVSRQSQR